MICVSAKRGGGVYACLRYLGNVLRALPDLHWAQTKTHPCLSCLSSPMSFESLASTASLWLKASLTRKEELAHVHFKWTPACGQRREQALWDTVGGSSVLEGWKVEEYTIVTLAAATTLPFCVSVSRPLVTPVRLMLKAGPLARASASACGSKQKGAIVLFGTGRDLDGLAAELNQPGRLPVPGVGDSAFRAVVVPSSLVTHAALTHLITTLPGPVSAVAKGPGPFGDRGQHMSRVGHLVNRWTRYLSLRKQLLELGKFGRTKGAVDGGVDDVVHGGVDGGVDGDALHIMLP
jgi:hypothetical protein